MTEPRPLPSDRLDSWKAIAEYLQRDVRTVRRWEKGLGLPVRRVPGGRGHSVFAYVPEIEAWLKATPPASLAANGGAGGETREPEEEADARAAPPSAPEAPAAASPGRRTGRARWWHAAAALAMTGTALLGWRLHLRGADASELQYEVTTRAIVASVPGGAERWRYAAPAAEDIFPIRNISPAAKILANGEGALVGVDRKHRTTTAPLGGQLLWLTSGGALRRSFEYTGELAFGAGTYGEPWTLTDYAVHEEGPARRVAVAVRHYEWWPSFVTILDERWAAAGRFVNPGWIEYVHWLSSTRLVISGFSNARDAAFVALLDANAADGQAPIGADPAFRCTGCGTAAPLRYIVLPRTEVNRAAVGPPNSGRMQVAGGRVLVRAIEMSRDVGHAPEVLYEFSPSLDLVRASFGDRYWDVHDALAREGRIAHTRERCPDRQGPRTIEVWEPGTGWRTVDLRTAR